LHFFLGLIFENEGDKATGLMAMLMFAIMWAETRSFVYSLHELKDVPVILRPWLMVWQESESVTSFSTV